ncbi:hypothetical protein [Chlamydia psittaci]|nr:hypothetical protein [Chlamydia psittaci]
METWLYYCKVRTRNYIPLPSGVISRHFASGSVSSYVILITV